MKENIYIIETKLLYCPECECEHEVKLIKRKSKSIIKNQVVEYNEFLYYCENSNEIFETVEMINKNLLSARDSYRKKNDLLTSKDIIEIRKKYNISQEEMSILLNLGEKTITRYENKSIQDIAYNTLMVMFNKNYTFALDCLNKNKDKFTKKRYNELLNLIKELIEKDNNESLIENEISNKYMKYDNKNEYNGNRKLNINKIKNMIIYFANNTKNLFKVKLMKLFWYSDVYSYLKEGKSITGLVYEHMPYGALPIAWDQIIGLDVVEKEYSVYNNHECVLLKPSKSKFNEKIFSDNEIEILKIISEKFCTVSATEISNKMHEEEIYKNTTNHEILRYDNIKNLNFKFN